MLEWLERRTQISTFRRIQNFRTAVKGTSKFIFCISALFFFKQQKILKQIMRNESD